MFTGSMGSRALSHAWTARATPSPRAAECRRRTQTPMFSSATLAIDPEKTAQVIEHAIRRQVGDLRRRGIVVGLSGGIDSSVVTCLCARALGAERVQVLFMPELALVARVAHAGAHDHRQVRHPRRGRRHRPDARGGRLLRPPDRSHPHDVPGVRRGLAQQDHAAVDSRQRPAERVGADRRVAERRAEDGAHAAGRPTCRWWRPPTSSSACAR